MLNTLDIYKLLEKTNCKECGAPTCMAFAALVTQGQKKLDQCPYIPKELIKQYGSETNTRISFELEQEKAVKYLKSRIHEIDFKEAKERLGAELKGKNLVIKCLGRDFIVDPDGDVCSECHTHIWIRFPLLNFIINCKGIKPTGKWVLFSQLQDGSPLNPLFIKRCQEPLIKSADRDMTLFFEILSLFGNELHVDEISADKSVILYPVPMLPVLIAYWKPEEDIDSTLNIYFDSSADKNFDIDSIFRLCVGLAMMFEKFMYTHRESYPLRK